MTAPSLARRALAATFAALSLATACKKDGDDDEKKTQPVIAAGTVVVTSQPFVEYVGAIGTVRGRPGHVASIAAPAPARVTRVAVAVGDRVTPGRTLVELDQTAFAAERGSSAAALVNAQRNLDRTRRLVAEGIAPRKDLDQAEADVAQARGAASTAARQASLAVIRSPISGVVTSVRATLGATADPAQALVEVADPNALDVVLDVSPEDAAKITRGAKVLLTAGQKASADTLGVATIVDVAGAIDSASRSVTVRAQAPTTRRVLRIGEAVYGQIVASTRAEAIVVPAEALVPDGEEFKVWVVGRDSIARARKVEVGSRSATTVEITDGLRAGERIVTYGAYGVDEGSRIVERKGSRTP